MFRRCVVFRRWRFLVYGKRPRRIHDMPYGKTKFDNRDILVHTVYNLPYCTLEITCHVSLNVYPDRPTPRNLSIHTESAKTRKTKEEVNQPTHPLPLPREVQNDLAFVFWS